MSKGKKLAISFRKCLRNCWLNFDKDLTSVLYCIFEQRKQKQIFIYIFCAIVKGLKLFRESLTTKQIANIEIYDLVRLIINYY